ncbi:MAG: penicillin-binding protein 1A [Thiobacillus sp.]|nr:penicillin-binding protein 1A [Thiobacillus sp.]
MRKKWWYLALVTAAGLLAGAVAVAGLAVALVYPSLPSLDVLTDYRPKMSLKVYSEDGGLLAEFGEERRSVVRLQDVPLVLRQAILAAEDERFYEHGGVDTVGVLRAAVSNVLSGGVREGASTITMQVARNFFLSSERTMRRKLNEVLLAFKIEHALSKDEIFELYLNQIYLGQRAYGFAAAAQTYFGKPVGQISLAEAAMLAGLPKAPSSFNPVVNPARAKMRQQYVLRRMHELRFISDAQLAQAKASRLVVRGSSSRVQSAGASHLAEMARQYLYQRYGEQIYSSGMRVYTTLRMAEQKAAEDAVRTGVVEFNRRRGYPGPEAQLNLPADADERARVESDALARDEANGLLPAVVTEIGKKQIQVRLRGGEEVALGESEVKFARYALSPKTPAAKRLRVGSLVRVVQLAPGQPWQLTYLPQVEAALVAISPADGAIRALVGGFDFARNQFNHATQAWRQPGSSFKPFIYSAALERGITPATIFDDAPLEVDPAQTGDQLWEPKNYDGEMDGPVTVRTALIKSKNLVAIRLLQAATTEFAQAHALRFGFTPGRIPPYLTMALGAGEVTALQLASAYAVFANGGMLPKPYYLTKVTDKDGKVLEQFAAQPAERVLEPRNAFVMTSLLQDVVRRGTAAAASSLGRTDLAGKTGTTNDHRDAWFAGYNPDRVAITWMGYDQPRPLGPGETGSQAALPIWMRYMSVALKDVPMKTYLVPEGVVTINVDPDTGVPDSAGQPEYFFQEFTPAAQQPPGGWGLNAP